MMPVSKPKDLRTMPTIRELGEQDMPAYHALRLAGLEAHPDAFGETADHFRRTTIDQLAVDLAISSSRGGFRLGAFEPTGKLIGVVSMGRSDGEKSKHRGLIWGMYVAAEARGKGMGRHLLEKCIERAKLLPGLEQLQLSVVTSNVAACSLYKSLGFVCYGEDRGALKIGEDRFDEFLMVKWLLPQTGKK